MLTSPRPLQADRRIDAGELSVAYVDSGDPSAESIVLLHGFPYDIHSYDEVVPLLVEAGFRVIVPYLRGHGATTFLDEVAPRPGQQAALGADLRALIDALGLDRPVVAGFGWGGRAACVVASLWPERVRGLVSVNGYLVQDLTSVNVPARPDVEAALWYLWYFATDRGRTGLMRDRAGVAEAIWRGHSPEWGFTAEQFRLTAAAFDNRDYVEVVIHAHRHGLGIEPGIDTHESVEQRLRDQPAISVPTVTLDGEADGSFKATDGSAGAHHFIGRRWHRRVPNAGHNLPSEAPHIFAEAVLDVADPPSFGEGTP